MAGNSTSFLPVLNRSDFMVLMPYCGENLPTDTCGSRFGRRNVWRPGSDSGSQIRLFKFEGETGVSKAQSKYLSLGSVGTDCGD